MKQSVKLPDRKIVQRRASGLSKGLSEAKLAEIRSLSAAQRLMLALDLSDTCRELQRACSPKR